MTTCAPWVSVDVVDEHPGLPNHLVCRWIESGSLPVHEVGRTSELELSAVDARVETSEMKPNEREGIGR